MHRISDFLNETCVKHELTADGEFEALEQCTRIRGKASLTFLENKKYIDALQNENISCVLCTPEIGKRLPPHIKGAVVTEQPKVLFFQMLKNQHACRELRPTVIAPGADISPLAYVAPYNVVIERNVTVEPFVVINEGSILREGTRVCANSVIGAQSYTVIKESSSRAFIATDLGRTVLEEGVQIGSNCTIERGTLEHDATILKPYCMLDNGVLIGHGTVVGERSLIAAETIVSGNCIFGDRIWIGVNGTISNAISIGDDARVSLGAVVTKDVPAGETVTGNFAINHRRFISNLKQSTMEGQMFAGGGYS